MTFDEVVAQSLAPETLQSVFNAYQQAQTGSDVAAQDQLPMRLMAPLLPNIALLEYVDQDSIIYRIAGENVAARFGFNPAGTNFLDFLDASIRAEISHIYELSLEQRCGLYAVYESQYESGFKMMSESLMLPIRKSLHGEIAFFLGYHVHHQTTDVDIPGIRTVVGTRWVIVDYVDIGFGIPRTVYESEHAHGRRRA